jgi:RNA polymerase sigma factor (sigma-70 family)
MGLVHYCLQDILGSKQHSLRSITVDDLIQEGSIGLARAVDKYDPTYRDTSPAKFSTYAVYWIRAAILRCLAEKNDVMHIPEHVTTAIRTISKAASALGVSLEEENHTTHKILSDATGLSDSLLRNAILVRNRRRKHSTSVLSFESWMQLGKDYEVDLVQNDRDSVSSATLNMENIKQTLSIFLRPKEMEALSWRYGLNNNEHYHGPDSDVSIATEFKNPLAKRNYLAQAELELFGTTSILDNEHLSKYKKGQALPKQQPLAFPTKGKWGEAMSFTDVGKQMKISGEYGRKLCHAAIHKLRRAVEEGMLEEPRLLF